MVINSFYNTLIDKEDAIPVSTMLEIERIRKNNHKFTIMTNRSCKELLEYNRDFPFIDYIISYNGSYVYDVENSKCLLDEKLKEEDIEFIKNGACPTFIKSGSNVEVVKAVSLPAGMLEDIDLVVYDKDLKGGEIVVMCSDRNIRVKFWTY